MGEGTERETPHPARFLLVAIIGAVQIVGTTIAADHQNLVRQLDAIGYGLLISAALALLLKRGNPSGRRLVDRAYGPSVDESALVPTVQSDATNDSSFPRRPPPVRGRRPRTAAIELAAQIPAASMGGAIEMRPVVEG